MVPVPNPEFFSEGDRKAVAELNDQIAAVADLRRQADALALEVIGRFAADLAVDRRPVFEATCAALEAEAAARDRLVGYYLAVNECREQALRAAREKLLKIELSARRKTDLPTEALTPRSVLECTPGYVRTAVEAASLEHFDNRGPVENDEARAAITERIAGLRSQIVGEGKRLHDLAEHRKQGTAPAPLTGPQQRSAEKERLAAVFRDAH